MRRILLLSLATMAPAGCQDEPAPIRPLAPTATAPSTQTAAPRRELDYQVQRIIKTDLERLTGIAVTSDGDRIFAVGRGGVRVLDAAGKTLRQWSTPTPATCVALDDEGFVYVGQNSRVDRYSASGKPVGHWGKAGRGPGEMLLVKGIAVLGSNVFVADAGNRVVHRFDITGDLIGDLGRKDPRAGVPGIIVRRPFLDCAVGPNGELYVTNPGRWLVEQYDLNGSRIGAWGGGSFKLDGFCGCCNPTHIAVDRRGRFLTAEKDKVRVKLCDATGKVLALVADQRAFSPKASGLDLAVDKHDRVYVADPGRNAIYVFVAKHKESADGP
jgi:DNA-binding beta-propeller fold protein YncE